METSLAVGRGSTDCVEKIFGRARGVVIGVIHCPAFPGAPRYRDMSAAALYETALADALAYARGGVDGLIVENHGDIPFSKPEDIGHETSAFMAVTADRIARETGLPIGINVLANAAMAALAIAAASNAAFVRVNQWANAYIANEGLIEGAAASALRYRARLRATGVRVFADAHVKHGAHAIVADRSLEELVRDVEFFDADAIIATGQRTGDAASPDYLKQIRAATTLPLLIGSGCTEHNISEILSIVDGVIVASSLKAGGQWWNPVDEAKVRTFMRAAR
ncbi:BtpA family membrane complex biogenesis protein [Verminephrobacter eiseniae]|uniref:BtpA/SgcQ family protein n=1 Tax=Verminephrobacter eiseniae TaxID=364317 RepID=UPI002238CE52|nr:BtpA/SgcQ family protein [Verminephrobacter eiseniae]MCW5262420.1 BtpA family membrane complex biogenesis protein [Verminephrobacter eiseniae]